MSFVMSKGKFEPIIFCGFYEVFSDKPKIIFSSCAVINVWEFHFARLVSCVNLAKR